MGARRRWLPGRTLDRCRGDRPLQGDRLTRNPSDGVGDLGGVPGGTGGLPARLNVFTNGAFDCPEMPASLIGVSLSTFVPSRQSSQMVADDCCRL